MSIPVVQQREKLMSLASFVHSSEIFGYIELPSIFDPTTYAIAFFESTYRSCEVCKVASAVLSNWSYQALFGVTRALLVLRVCA